ncbi:MAG: hypothetical protein M3Y83_05940 [Actinomycetota bacterium]|nr:hypothetical protein [Actinomycetota bacterium]
MVSFTQVGSSLSVRLRNPNPDVGLVRSPFELALVDPAGTVIATEGQGGLPGTPVNTIYQLPPGGEYGLDIATVPNGKTVASVELTVIGKWFKWDTVNPPTVTVTDATVRGDTGYSGPSATGRLTLDKDGPLNVVVKAFVITPLGTVVSDVTLDCVQTGQQRTFETNSYAFDARGPYRLDKIVAYTTAVKGAGPEFSPNCSSAPASASPTVATRTTPQATTPTSSRASTPTATRHSLPPTVASTSDVTGASTGGSGKLVTVRLGARADGDRLVFEFLDGIPSYKVGYRPLPARADGSGNEIPLPGANALVQVVFTAATGDGWTDGVQTYFGPSTVTGDTTVITEAKAAGDFEAVLTWVVGLRSQVPFRVSVLDGPPRLVIDFYH